MVAKMSKKRITQKNIKPTNKSITFIKTTKKRVEQGSGKRKMRE